MLYMYSSFVAVMVINLYHVTEYCTVIGHAVQQNKLLYGRPLSLCGMECLILFHLLQREWLGSSPSTR